VAQAEVFVPDAAAAPALAAQPGATALGACDGPDVAGLDVYVPAAQLNAVIWRPGKPKTISEMVKTFSPRLFYQSRITVCPPFLIKSHSKSDLGPRFPGVRASAGAAIAERTPPRGS
jgi:hypothetical protein